MTGKRDTDQRVFFAKQNEKRAEQCLTCCHTENKIGIRRQRRQYGTDRQTKIRVDADTYKRLCAYAKANKMTITDVVLKGLDKALSDS